MEQPKKAPLEILEICKITPSSSPPAEFSLPLTFFDLMFFRTPPTERILFYSFAADQPRIDSILQNLKRSLSLALSHFLPLAGNLVWPDHSPEPIILYKPGDSVSLTIAKTDADFNHLSANHVRKANESHFLLPELQTSDTLAPAMCLQITLFPNRGLSIGIVTNHVVADGKTSTTFLKSWASICSRLYIILPTLPPELTPVFDRTAARDPNGLHKLYLEKFGRAFPNPKRFKLTPKVAISDDIVSGTFELTRVDIENLRRKAAATSSSTSHLTTFVLILAHVSTCIIKAQGIEAKGKAALAFLVDWRPRVGALGGLNYFGNHVSGPGVFLEAREFEEENAMVTISKMISDEVAGTVKIVKEENFVEMLEESLVRWGKEMPIPRRIAVAGSPRFGLYGIDFGWGGCKKVEMVVSINPGGSFSMAESRNGNGGVEVGIALPSEVMNSFCSLFEEGLKNGVN